MSNVKFKKWEDCTHEEQVERWENVIRVLKALTPHERRKHFRMNVWGLKTECGTVGCAAGFCGLDPWFRRRGFKLIPEKLQLDADDKNYYKHNGGIEAVISDRSGAGTFDGIFGLDIVPKFFGYDGTDYIFHNSDPRSVTTVIAEVKEHIQYLKDCRKEESYEEEVGGDV